MIWFLCLSMHLKKFFVEPDMNYKCRSCCFDHWLYDGSKLSIGRLNTRRIIKQLISPPEIVEDGKENNYKSVLCSKYQMDVQRKQKKIWTLQNKIKKVGGASDGGGETTRKIYGCSAVLNFGCLLSCHVYCSCYGSQKKYSIQTPAK